MRAESRSTQIASHVRLSAMTEPGYVFSLAWNTTEHAVAKADFQADLHKAPEMISKTVKRRVSAALKHSRQRAKHLARCPRPRLGRPYHAADRSAEGVADPRHELSQTKIRKFAGTRAAFPGGGAGGSVTPFPDHPSGPEGAAHRFPAGRVVPQPSAQPKYRRGGHSGIP